jgi:hypothetical protein
VQKLVRVTLVVWLSMTGAVLAQEPASRAEADRQRREEKQKAAQAYQQGTFEQGMHFAEERAIFILDREGFYPKFGTLTTGSGFAYGIGFRDRDLFNHYGQFDIFGAASIKRYWAAEVRLRFPELAGKRLLLETWAGRRDYPQENFFGFGPDSLRSDRSDYAFRTNLFGGRAGVRPFPVVLVGGGVEFLQPVVGRGRNDRVPNLEDTFDTSAVPGFDTPADFLRSSAFIEVDYREPKYARKGGWYRFDLSNYDDRTQNLYSFRRFDVDLRQFVGFLGERRVLAARLFVSTSDAEDGQTMPFYYMPTLGGNDTLRGFREYRFRAPHAILAQAEYRYEIWSGFDAALFYDAGKVANRRSDLDFENLESDYGIGFRFNTNSGVILRVDAAFGSPDGKHLYVVFGGVF